MKALGMMMAVMLMLLLVCGAQAQAPMRLYVQEGALEDGQAQRLLALLQAEFEEDHWTLTQGAQTLRELVLSDHLPDLAICAPGEARTWAREGLLVPLQTQISGQQRMQRQVLDLCVQDEVLFMAPLIAHHRQMAVNTGRFEDAGLGYMLDMQTYPVWYPAQFYQILEEFLIRGETAMDIWRAQGDAGAAIEAMTQAIYGGMLLSEDGMRSTADDASLLSGVQWLKDAVDAQMIGYCETREDALERFLAGETAIFIDWTQKLQRQAAEHGFEIEQRPYPSAIGIPVRSFELTGACAFASGETARDARLARACAYLHEHAQDILGARGIWQDGAIWLAGMDADHGATLRSLFCEALREVLEEGEDARQALMRIQAAMDTLEETK